jgi:hypothetical protein
MTFKIQCTPSSKHSEYEVRRDEQAKQDTSNILHSETTKTEHLQLNEMLQTVTSHKFSFWKKEMGHDVTAVTSHRGARVG